MFAPASVLAVLPSSRTVTWRVQPPASISVERSGIVPPLSAEPTLVPGVASREAVPVVDTFGDDLQFDVDRADPIASYDGADPAALKPPLSNVELAPVDKQFALGTRLKPPGSISVAPIGTPVPPGALALIEPGMPSGEVAPIPGAVALVAVCAYAMSQLNAALPPVRQVLVVDMAVLIVLGVGRRATEITPGSPRVGIIVGMVARARDDHAARMTKEPAIMRGREGRRGRHQHKGGGGEQHLLHRVHIRLFALFWTSERQCVAGALVRRPILPAFSVIAAAD
jgi:hypothetical protein